jgi:hypothetical protein
MEITNRYPETINNRVMYPYNCRKKYYIIEDENDVGVAKQRLRASDPTIYHSMSLRFNYEELKIFEDWVELNLKGGIIPFYFPFKTPTEKEDTIRAVKFVINDGLCYEVEYSEASAIVSFEVMEV